jgi:thioester reductase-like protein
MLIELLGHTVTVFGATGFLGRYIVNRLGTTSPDFTLQHE